MADLLDEIEFLDSQPKTAKTEEKIRTLADEAAEIDAIRKPPMVALPANRAPTVNDIPGQVAPTGPAPPQSQVDRLLGLPDAAISAVRGAASAPAYALGRVLGNEATANKWADTVAGQPFTQTGREIMTGLGKVMEASKLGGMGPAEAGMLAAAPHGPIPFVTPGIKTGANALEQQLAAKLPAERPVVPPVAALAPPPGVTVPPVATAPVRPVTLAPAHTAAEVQQMLSTASPEVRASIEQAALKGPVHVEAAIRQLEADSLPVPLKLTPGQARQDPALISDELNRRAKIPGMVDALNEQNSALSRNLEAIRERAAPNLVDRNRADSGASLIGEYKTLDDARRAEISAKYKALEDANGGKFPMDGPKFAEDALSQKKTRFLPSEIFDELKDIKEGRFPMTFESFEDLRTTLAAETRKAERAGDGNKVHAISLVRESLENMPMSTETAVLKPLADEARSAAKARFDALKRDPAYKAAVEDSVSSADFLDKFVARGKPESVKEMVDNLGGSQSAKEAMAAGVINHLKEKSRVLEGGMDKFSSKSFRTALERLDPTLDMLVDPDSAKNLRTLGKVSAYSTNQPAGSYVNNSNTLTGAIREGAVGIAEHGANAAAGAHGIPIPVGSAGRAIFKGRAAKKEAEQILKPGAGVEMRDLPR